MYDLRERITKNIEKETTPLKPDSKKAFLYKDELTGKMLVLKILSDFEDEFLNELFYIDEFRKLVDVSTLPEIASVYFLISCKHEGEIKAGYCMEYCSGQTLKSFSESQKLSLDDFLFIAEQLIRGIETAHTYNVFHNDLHDENILIDEYNRIKIIDFLWRDFGHSLQDNITRDIRDLKKVLITLGESLNQKDQFVLRYIEKILDSSTSLFGLSNAFKALMDFVKDISLLEERHLPTLAKFLEILCKDYKLSRCYQLRDFNIPEQFIPELNDEDNDCLEKNKKATIFNDLKTTKIKQIILSDTRLRRFSNLIHKQLHYKLNSLILLGILDYSYKAENLGEEFIGPYNFNVYISFTPKAMAYKNLNEKFKLLPDCKSIIIDDILFNDFAL